MLLSADAVLESRVLAHHVEALLTKSTALFVETGDAWFHGQKMTLPDDCGYGVCVP
jgi:pyruvate decarboxylase